MGLLHRHQQGTSHIDPMGNPVGCDIGLMLRDDFAMEILKTASKAVLASPGWIIDLVSTCARAEIRRSEIKNGDSAEKLEYEIRQLTQKKESILDAFFSKDITKEEMRLMNERYDRQMAELQTNLQAAREREWLTYETATLKADVKMHISDLAGREVDESFCQAILDTITVYPDRRAELRLNLLPQKWRFVLNSIADIRHRSGAGCHYDPSVPISVSNPFSSSKGME